MAEQFSDDEKLRCLEREIALRRKVYPGLISKGNVASKTAFREIALMEAIAADYRAKLASKVVED
jgi:hypothetical protein